MKPDKSLTSNCSFFFTTLVIVEMILFFQPTFGTSDSITPAQGLFCISECQTCPLICAPPPPPTKSATSPPSPIKAPPAHHSSPPDDQSYYFDSPPPPKKSSPAYPPPSYITWGQSPTSPSPPPPPPPSSPDLNNVPVPGGQGTFPSYNTGQKNSSNPYYYFYASKGSFLAPHLSYFLVPLLFSHATFWCC